jgi:hypothetical protein
MPRVRLRPKEQKPKAMSRVSRTAPWDSRLIRFVVLAVHGLTFSHRIASWVRSPVTRPRRWVVGDFSFVLTVVVTIFHYRRPQAEEGKGSAGDELIVFEL